MIKLEIKKQIVREQDHFAKAYDTMFHIWDIYIFLIAAFKLSLILIIVKRKENNSEKYAWAWSKSLLVSTHRFACYMKVIFAL